MALFQLSPKEILERRVAVPTISPTPVLAPLSLGGSITRGMVGGTLLSLAGFAPWAVTGAQLHRWVGEAGLYGVCALVFIGLSGPLLHALIVGPGSLGRFYKLFSVTFGAYSAAWIAGWMALRGHPGSLVGLLAGTAAMGWLLCLAFDAPGQRLAVIAALFVLNAAGYFAGGACEGWIAGMKHMTVLGSPVSRHARMVVAMLSWGFWYGLGLGAGLGFAFHACQSEARRLLGGTPDDRLKKT
jgi:hypothetical protein